MWLLEQKCADSRILHVIEFIQGDSANLGNFVYKLLG